MSKKQTQSTPIKLHRGKVPPEYPGFPGHATVWGLHDSPEEGEYWDRPVVPRVEEGKKKD